MPAAGPVAQLRGWLCIAGHLQLFWKLVWRLVWSGYCLVKIPERSIMPHRNSQKVHWDSTY